MRAQNKIVKQLINVSCIIIIACLLLFLLIINSFFVILKQPIDISAETPKFITVGKNTSAKALVGSLQKEHLIDSKYPLLIFLRFTNTHNKLKAGTYEIEPFQSVLSLVDNIIAGKVVMKTIAFIEGSTIKDVFYKLSANEFINYNQENLLFTKDFHNSLEGQVLADTYTFAPFIDSSKILNIAHIALTIALNDIWENRSADLPYKNPYELLITASIIEKETAIEEEKYLISSVIVNRLRKNMRLQMDPTVIYALGDNYSGNLTRKDLQVESPYNTYKVHGLPPTPIAIVGMSSLKAAAHPDNTSYLYFVAKGNGRHEFSVTYKEQQKAIKKYRSSLGLAQVL